jgi:hypothetical protein
VVELLTAPDGRRLERGERREADLSAHGASRVQDFVEEDLLATKTDAELEEESARVREMSAHEVIVEAGACATDEGGHPE